MIQTRKKQTLPMNIIFIMRISTVGWMNGFLVPESNQFFAIFSMKQLNFIL